MVSSVFDDSAQLEESPAKRDCLAWCGGESGNCTAEWAAGQVGKLAGMGSEGDWRDGDYCGHASIAGGGFADSEEADRGYGADELLPLIRRPEMLAVAWLVLLLATATGVNLYTALAPPGRQRAQASVTLAPPHPRMPPRQCR